MSEQGIKKESDIRTNNLTSAQVRSLFKLSAREAAILDAYPLDSLLQLLASGHTQREIAAITGANQATVSTWLATQTGEVKEAIQAARRASAEANMDRAHKALLDVDTDNPVSATVGKDLARHFEKRAAMRDRAAWSDKGELAPIAAPFGSQAMPSFTIRILNAPNQQVTIQQDEAGEDLA